MLRNNRLNFLILALSTLSSCLFGAEKHSDFTPKKKAISESETILLHSHKIMDYIRMEDLKPGSNPSILNKCTEKLRQEYISLKLGADEKLHVRCRKVKAFISFVKPNSDFASLPPFIVNSGEPTSVSAFLTVSCEPRPEGERYRKEMSLICRDLARRVVKGEGNNAHHHSTNPAWQYEQLGCSVFSEEALNKIPNTKFTDIDSLNCSVDNK